MIRSHTIGKHSRRQHQSMSRSFHIRMKCSSRCRSGPAKTRHRIACNKSSPHWSMIRSRKPGKHSRRQHRSMLRSSRHHTRCSSRCRSGPAKTRQRIACNKSSPHWSMTRVHTTRTLSSLLPRRWLRSFLHHKSYSPSLNRYILATIRQHKVCMQTLRRLSRSQQGMWCTRVWPPLPSCKTPPNKRRS